MQKKWKHEIRYLHVFADEDKYPPRKLSQQRKISLVHIEACMRAQWIHVKSSFESYLTAWI